MARLKLGMVGGGQGAFIGAVHRIASRIDDRFELVAGALSSDADRTAASAAELGIAADRSYTKFADMAKAEAARADGINAVSIVTPNHMHAAPAIAFLEAGIHVICDKPLCTTQEEEDAIAAAVRASKARFILTHNYTGYPLIRHAREMVARGELGRIRVVVIGGGVVGTNAIKMAVGMGAEVTILDRSLERLREIDDLFEGRVRTLYSTRDALENEVLSADVVIGGVLIPGASAPKLVTRDMLSSMIDGSVLVDVAIDQGGCFETSKATMDLSRICAAPSARLGRFPFECDRAFPAQC